MRQLSIEYAKRELVKRFLGGDDDGVKILRGKQVADGWVSYVFGKTVGNKVWLVASKDAREITILPGIDAARRLIEDCSYLKEVPRNQFSLEWVRNDVGKQDGSLVVVFSCYAPDFAKQFKVTLHPDASVTTEDRDL